MAIEFLGSATSDFQAEPVCYDSKGAVMPPVSDWEYELARCRDGKSIGMSGVSDQDLFPRFLKNKELYLKRSAELGENMFRFSIDFARLCPKEGEFNKVLMAEYMKALAVCRARGEEPMLTLYHWPMPRYLLKIDETGAITKGGWEHPDVLKHFSFYIKSVTGFLKDPANIRTALAGLGFKKEEEERFVKEGLVRYFISLNEPINLFLPAYILGMFPPYKKWRFDIVPKVLRRVVQAHDIAAEEVRKIGGLVGVAHHQVFFDGMVGGIFGAMNEYITRRIERDGTHTDFLGLQYYFRKTLPLFGGRERGGRVYGDNPNFGDIYPQGVCEILKRMHATYPKKQIFITEFGFSDKDDRRRPYWILETMRCIKQAIDDGVPVKGVLVWTLVDNFEWMYGMSKRLGLFTEAELGAGLMASKTGIRSWEAWQANIAAIRYPSPENLRILAACYDRAKVQYDAAL